MAAKKSKRSRSKRKKLLLVSALVLLLAGLFITFKIFGPNTGPFTKGEYLYIRTGSGYDAVKNALDDGGFIRDVTSFDIIARKAGYPGHIHAGKYRIVKGMSNYDIVKLLHSGKQTPVKLVINRLRTRQDFIRLVSANLEADSNVLNHIFSDSIYLAQFGLDTNTVMCAVMPDTYEFYWNSTADKVFRKIERQYAAFWNDTRKGKARKLGLTPQQVVILASIVEEESNKKEDKPLIASVYLNRLKMGMRLQADPTARFAWGDFTIRRITSLHIGIMSPYNTYYVSGLPPGPICTPLPQSIDAVLNAPKTTYLYFCAREDFSGYHNFASTLSEQLQNAKKYHDALNARGIR